MPNEIDLGKLQDNLDTIERRVKSSTTRLKSAKAALIRAEDILSVDNDNLYHVKEQIKEAARALTK